MAAPFDADTFKLDLEINQLDLNTGFSEQASLFAFYAAKAATAMLNEAKSKLLMEVAEAKLDKQFRDEAASTGTKTTEPQIGHAITRSPDYIRAVMAYNDAKAMSALAASAVESFKQRRDMLIQLGANQRKDMEGELSMRSRMAQNAADATAAARGVGFSV